MKKMSKKVKILCAVIAAALLIAGGMFVVMNLFGKFPGIEKEALERYSYSSGGDMLGSSYSETVQEYDDNTALITIMRREWHSDDGSVKEYLVDRKILDELKAVFVKYCMKNWDNKQISNLFVADGASYRYGFDFEINSVSFSSQFYPEKYSSKLRELDEIIKKHLSGAELLPGLVVPEAAENLDYKPPYDTNSGKVTLSVYSYYRDYLCYRLTNGTDNDIQPEGAIRIYRDGESTPVFEQTIDSSARFSAHSVDEGSVKLEERLSSGKYRLEAFGYTAEFEIR